MEEYGLTGEEALCVGYCDNGAWISMPLGEVITNYGIGSREYALAVYGTIAHAVLAWIGKKYPQSPDTGSPHLLRE